MDIAVRMDDITPDMDWESFLSMKEILDAAGIKPLIGIVPDNKDQMLKCGEMHADFWQQIRQLQQQGWSIAMHGYQHLYETKQGGLFPLNHFSEFAGLSYEIQYEKLKKGKEILEKNGIGTNLFMAPGHSYDKNTLRALVELGFTYVTDGFGYQPYHYKGITFLPIAYHSRKSIRKKGEKITTLVYHMNGSTPEQIQEIRRLFAEADLKFISYSNLLQKQPVHPGSCMRLLEYGGATAKHYLVVARSWIKKLTRNNK